MLSWQGRLDARDVAIRRFCANSFADIAPRYWAGRLACALAREATLRTPPTDIRRLALARILSLNNGASLSRACLSYILAGSRTPPRLKFTVCRPTLEAIEPHIGEGDGANAASQKVVRLKRRVGERQP